MGAMYRLKAYFGMVPAEELEYAEEAGFEPRRALRDAGDYGAPDYAGRGERDWTDRDRAARRPRPTIDERDRYDGDRYGSFDAELDRRAVRVTAEERPSAPVRPAPVRGSLAIDTGAVPERPSVAPPVPEQRERPLGGAAALARITTLQPSSYNEARTIGERYRDGIPVIMNLSELDDASAKRLVDFAAGLVFALRGGFDKVTNRVFLLTPADVEVSADDARKLVSGARTGVMGADGLRFRQD